MLLLKSPPYEVRNITSDMYVLCTYEARVTIYSSASARVSVSSVSVSIRADEGMEGTRDYELGRFKASIQKVISRLKPRFLGSSHTLHNHFREWLRLGYCMTIQSIDRRISRYI
jgi:hypothetical protein